MKGWFNRSGLDPVINSATHCGRKRHFSKRAAETAEKHTRNTAQKQYRYKCDRCPKTREQKIEDATKVVDSAISSLQDIKWMLKHYDGDPADLKIIRDDYIAVRDVMLKLKELRILG